MSLTYWGWYTALPCSPWLSLRAQVVLSWDLASLAGVWERLAVAGERHYKKASEQSVRPALSC